MDISKDLLLKAMTKNLEIVEIVCQSTMYDNMKKEKLDKLRESMKTYCSVDNNFKKYEQCTKELEKRRISGNVDAEDMDFKKMLEILSKQKEDVTRHTMYNKFEEKIRTAQTEEDDEDMVISEYVPNTICPVSKKTMINPVTNELCGHTYDQSSIVELLKGHKKGIRCPVPGCVQSISSTQVELKPNDTLKTFISEQVKQ